MLRGLFGFAMRFPSALHYVTEYTVFGLRSQRRSPFHNGNETFIEGRSPLMSQPQTDYFTTQETSELLRRSPETLRYWRARGDGPHWFKIGRRVLYARADVEAFIADARAASRTGGAA